jgi:hypothetical protein
VPDLKEELHRKLQASRAVLLSRLDGLSEYDRRRPMSPTGTNLLGLVKHLAGLEYGYLGEALGHPAPEAMSWIEDGSIWQDADMWATPEETSEYITGLYQRACAHADHVITSLTLDAPASVEHWPADRQETTLGILLIRMAAETAQHAGHADIIRELIDGKAGTDHDTIDEPALQAAYLAQVQAAADTFASSRPPARALPRDADASREHRPGPAPGRTGSARKAHPEQASLARAGPGHHKEQRKHAPGPTWIDNIDSSSHVRGIGQAIFVATGQPEWPTNLRPSQIGHLCRDSVRERPSLAKLTETRDARRLT